MARRLIPFTLVSSLGILVACNDDRGAADAERPYAFTVLEYPGATLTVASDIADDGRVVGWYTVDSIPKGFVYDDGEYTSIEYPNAVLTHVTGIASDGSLVGGYRKAGAPQVAWHGFLRKPSGEFVEIHHPAHPHSMAQRILDDGTILGCYHDDDFRTSMRGFALSRGEFTVQEIPGSMTNGGTPDGRLVGMILGEGGRSAFIVEDGQVTHLEAPGSTSTEAWDINEAGAIVGAMVDSTEVSRGFVLENGRWTPIHPPDARSAVAFGINARGEIVGGFEDAEGRRRGYLAARR